MILVVSSSLQNLDGQFYFMCLLKKEDSDAVLHLELFSSQLVPPSKGSAEKSF